MYVCMYVYIYIHIYIYIYLFMHAGHLSGEVPRGRFHVICAVLFLNPSF